MKYVSCQVAYYYLCYLHFAYKIQPASRMRRLLETKSVFLIKTKIFGICIQCQVLHMMNNNKIPCFTILNCKKYIPAILIYPCKIKIKKNQSIRWVHTTCALTAIKKTPRKSDTCQLLLSFFSVFLIHLKFGF